MAWIARRDEGALPTPVHQGPVLIALEVVVVGTEPVEELEDSLVGSRPVLAMVVLQEGDAVAALDGTRRIEPLKRALLVVVGPSPEVDASAMMSIRGCWWSYSPTRSMNPDGSA